jgi:hypothetical protein
MFGPGVMTRPKERSAKAKSVAADGMTILQKIL